MYDRNGRYVDEELIKAYGKWRFERLDRNIMSNKNKRYYDTDTVQEAIAKYNLMKLEKVGIPKFILEDCTSYVSYSFRTLGSKNTCIVPYLDRGEFIGYFVLDNEYLSNKKDIVAYLLSEYRADKRYRSCFVVTSPDIHTSWKYKGKIKNSEKLISQ